MDEEENDSVGEDYEDDEEFHEDDDEDSEYSDEASALGEDSLITRLQWNVVGYGNVPAGYTTDLYPVDEVRPLVLGSFEDHPLAQATRNVMYTVNTDT